MAADIANESADSIQDESVGMKTLEKPTATTVVDDAPPKGTTSVFPETSKYSDGLYGEEDIEVVEVDDRPVEDQVPPRDETRSTPEDGDFDAEVPDDGSEISKKHNRLRYEFHEARRAKEDAERLREQAILFAQQQKERNDHLESIVRQGETVLLDQIRASAKVKLEQAEANYRQAAESGDPEEMLAASKMLNAAQMESYTSESYNPAGNQRIQEEHVNPGQPYDQARAAVPQFDAQQQVQQTVAQDVKLTSWLTKNPWFNTNRQMHDVAMAIHEDLTKNSGVSPQSDEYYSQIDARIKSVFPGYFGVGNNTAPGQQTSPTQVMGGAPQQSAEGNGVREPAPPSVQSVVAPAGNRTPGTPNQVEITRSEAALISRLGIPKKAYAAHKRKLESKNG